jgi:hypothetical protein
MDAALRQGHRRLLGDSSLLQLLVKKRGVRDPRRLAHLTEELVLYWAELHLERTGKWPQYNSGPISSFMAAPFEFVADVSVAMIRPADPPIACFSRLVLARSRPADLEKDEQVQGNAQLTVIALIPTKGGTSRVASHSSTNRAASKR